MTNSSGQMPEPVASRCPTSMAPIAKSSSGKVCKNPGPSWPILQRGKEQILFIGKEKILFIGKEKILL